MYKAEEIRVVHLEITTRCNAMCPMCLRTVCGGKVNPQLPLVELSLRDIQKIFTPEFLLQLDRIYLCGNYGDPLVAQDTLAALQYFKSINPHCSLSFFTNGSARTTLWWTSVAPLVRDVHFGIDGLADTNHLYRRGTQFEIIMRNVQAFIAAGGNAIWDYIVFRHNEHQIEEAKKLAKEMGFKKFNLKKTGRFFSNTRSEVKTKQEVLNAAGEIEYYLEMPQDVQYTNSALKKEEELVKKYGHLEKYLDATSISCKVATEKSVYVSAEGFVFPCCWTGNQLYPWYFEPKSSQIWNTIRALPQKEKSISALHNSIYNVINGDFFSKIEGAWDKPTVRDGKLKVCAKTCGNEFDPFRAQFQK